MTLSSPFKLISGHNGNQTSAQFCLKAKLETVQVWHLCLVLFKGKIGTIHLFFQFYFKAKKETRHLCSFLFQGKRGTRHLYSVFSWQKGEPDIFVQFYFKAYWGTRHLSRQKGNQKSQFSFISRQKGNQISLFSSISSHKGEPDISVQPHYKAKRGPVIFIQLYEIVIPTDGQDTRVYLLTLNTENLTF